MGMVEPLSSRELDVLRLLRSDLSGPEIARELVVSLNTVRTHTKNIYTKLDVTNRRDAVRRADELGLQADHQRQSPHVVMTAHQVRSYGPSVTDSTGIPQYEIQVEGHLGPRWTAWFDGLSVTDADGGITVIRGPVVDQAALHGLLQKLRDIGLPLISVTQMPFDASTKERN